MDYGRFERKQKHMTENRTISLSITGMSCGGCVSAVKNALSSVPGVESAEVNLQSGSAKVVVGAADVPIEKLILAVKLAGYNAKLG